MNIVYLLKSDVTHHSSFIQDYSSSEDSIMKLTSERIWVPFDTDYKPVKLILRANDYGNKNYKFDISGSLTPFFIISELMLNALSDILITRGQILPVITLSKRKQFFGYYPHNPLDDCLDHDKTDYIQYPYGRLIKKPVLKRKQITDEYLFSIRESSGRVFVTDNFKQRVEEAGLVGFDFTSIVELS